MKIFAVLFLALFAGIAGAQTSPSVQASAVLSWVLPTKATDDTALTGANALTKIQVFASQASIVDTTSPEPVAELAANATAYTYSATVPNGATLYFRVKACTAAACSAFSAQVSKAVKVLIPNVPAGIAVTVTVTLTQ